MRYRRLGRTELQVSEIGLGALEMGRDWGIRIEGDFGRPPEDAAIHAIRGAVASGINFIDTAPAYQLSEERIGRALRGRRQDVYLATKVGEHYEDERGFWYDYSAPAVARSVEQSLHRLQTDVIDLLQIHSASAEIIERGETLDAMKRFQQAGHVRFLGMTGGVNAARAAIVNGGYDTVQVDYNILDQQAAHLVFPLTLEHDIGVIVMAPLAHGLLTDKWRHETSSDKRAQVQPLAFLDRPGQTLAQAAIRFVLANDAVSTVIAGSRKLDNVRQNVAAADASLSSEEMERIRNGPDFRMTPPVE